MQLTTASDFIMNKLRAELPQQLTYHSAAHIDDVYEAAKRIGMEEKLSTDELDLLLTAARYHDAGFLVNRENHENISCKMAQELLPGFEYSAQEIETICGMIMATKVPQEPTNKLEEVLADADLDYLGRDDYFSVSQKLFEELLAAGELHTEEEWNNKQVQFLQKHRYFTQTALKQRQAKKEENLARILASIKP